MSQWEIDLAKSLIVKSKLMGVDDYLFLRGLINNQEVALQASQRVKLHLLNDIFSQPKAE